MKGNDKVPEQCKGLGLSKCAKILPKPSGVRW